MAGGPTPGRADVLAAAKLPVTGWKALLSTVPPVDSARELVGLPFLLCALAAAFTCSLVTHSMRSWIGSLPAAALAVITMMTGTTDAWHPAAVGVGLAALSIGWAALRRRRHLRIVGTGGGARQQALVAVALIAISGALSWSLVPFIPGLAPDERFSVRTLVQPPFDMSEYASPLSGHHKFTEAMHLLWDQELVAVSGAAPGTRLRFSVLDDYRGSVWGAGNAAGVTDGSFQKVGRVIRRAGSTSTPSEQVTVTIAPAYAALPELAVWVPGIGEWTMVGFSGTRADDLRSALRYNQATGQGLEPIGLLAGDVIELTGHPIALAPTSGITPYGTGQVDAAATAFVSGLAEQWGGSGTSAWDRVSAVARQLRETGTYDGSADILPGHSEGRLTAFLAEPVGSDEQFAAAFALLANDLGLPTRVVLGAITPADGRVHGKDVRAWVEVRAESGEWFAIPNDSFMPKVGDQPNQMPPETARPVDHPFVPPPSPERPPGAMDSLSDAEAGLLQPKTRTTQQSSSNESRNELWPAWMVRGLHLAGPPIALLGGAALLLALARGGRRWRRRSSGSSSRRLATGWRDLVDHSRDLGVGVDLRATRREQACVIGHDDLARVADAAVFGAADPTNAEVRQFWEQVRIARRDLSRGAGWRRWLRFWSVRGLFGRGSEGDDRPGASSGRRFSVRRTVTEGAR
ncbi:MAG: transglutaminase-like domain-containing protein [Actinobacteria bacterium]|nr:transglutaminase-like domain-containing protein [Actinomycetota bacterium]